MDRRGILSACWRQASRPWQHPCVAHRPKASGRTGWWLLLLIIPIIGFIVLLIFFLQQSDPGENDYGAPQTATA